VARAEDGDKVGIYDGREMLKDVCGDIQGLGELLREFESFESCL
jgi:hypothetical protein